MRAWNWWGTSQGESQESLGCSEGEARNSSVRVSCIWTQNCSELRKPPLLPPNHLPSAAELLGALDLLSTLTALEMSTFSCHFSCRKPQAKRQLSMEQIKN